MIRIQSHMNPAIVLIIFDRIFHQIADGKWQFCLVNLRIHRTEAFQNQLNISFRSDRMQTF